MTKTKLTFIGTGSASTIRNWQTNTLISRGNKHLLIDAGGDVRRSLAQAQYSYKDLDAIYITHLHGDHTSGLEDLGFMSHFDPTCDKIKLYGNYTVLNELWSTVLVGRMACVQGRSMRLEDYFDVHPVFPNTDFQWEDVTFDIVQSVHIMNKYAIVHSYGLMFVDPATQKVIYYTGDTQFNPNQIMDFYQQADLVIQDCETSIGKSGVHASYTELITLPDDIKAKMMLTHYQDNVFDTEDNTASWRASAQGAGFTCWDTDNWGFIDKGEVFDTGELDI